MKKKHLSIETTMISILFILITALCLVDKVLSNDLFFDLKTGETILKYGIDFKDHFSFIPNLTYLYHHWLYDLIVLGIYNLFKLNGIFILFLLIFSAFGVSLFFVNKINSNRLIATLVAIFTMYITAYAFQFRVQSITYLLFFWEIYALEKLYKTGSKKYSFYLILIALIVVNLHMPLWIFCLILYLPYLAETILYMLSKKFKSSKETISLERPKNIKLLIITFLVLIITGLISPLKFYPYLFFSKSLFNGSFLFIGEMKKTALYYSKFEVILILVIVFGLYLKFLKLTLRDLFLLIGLFIFSLIARRNVVYFLIFAPTICLKSININYKFSGLKKTANLVKKINYEIVCTFTIVSLTCLYAITVMNFFIKKPDYSEESDFPDKVVKYIIKECDYKNMRLYTDFDYGSYLAFYNIPIFVDSRAEVYIKEFNGGYDIISDYHNSSKINTYKEVLNKYNFDYLLIYHESLLYQLLKKDKDYSLVFAEKDFIKYDLFKKNN